MYCLVSKQNRFDGLYRGSNRGRGQRGRGFLRGGRRGRARGGLLGVRPEYTPDFGEFREPIAASTPKNDHNNNINKPVSNRNKVSFLQNELAATSKHLADVSLKLATEQRLRMEAETREQKEKRKSTYYEGRARHFEYHARSNAKKLKLRQPPMPSSFEYPRQSY